MDCMNLRVFLQHESVMPQGNPRFGHQAIQYRVAMEDGVLVP